eukprot:4848039-Prymnesium_polylepis.1
MRRYATRLVVWAGRGVRKKHHLTIIPRRKVEARAAGTGPDGDALSCVQFACVCPASWRGAGARN